MSNSFAVLAEQDSNDLVEIVEADERATELQGFAALAGDHVLQVCDAFPMGFPDRRVQHLAIASERYAYATSDNKVCIGPIRELQDALRRLKQQNASGPFRPSRELFMPAPISHVAFSSDGSKIYVAATQGGLLVYNASSTDSGRQEITTSPLAELLPNPMDASLALLSANGILSIYSSTSGMTEVAQNVSAISWSKKGKQILAGRQDGRLEQYTPQGELKSQMAAVSADVGSVHALNWLENHLFLVAYMNDERDIAIYLLRRTPSQGSQGLRYTALSNPSLSFGDTSHPPHYSFVSLSKSLVMTVSSVSADVGLISLTHECSLSIEDEAQRAILRFSTDREAEVSVVGIAVQIDPVTSEKLIWYTDNDGGCGAWQIRDDENPLFEGKCASATEIPQVIPSASTIGTNEDKSRVEQNPFGKTASSGSVFPSISESMGNAKTSSPFTTGFASATPKPMFGSISDSKSLVPPQKSIFATSAAPVNTAFGSPAFGSSAFGSSAFGSTAFGSSAFGSSNTSFANSFTGFGQAAATSKELTSQQSTGTTIVQGNSPARSSPSTAVAKANMLDDDSDQEDLVGEDKLARIDEQEPQRLDNTFDFGSAQSAMNLAQAPASDNSAKVISFADSIPAPVFPVASGPGSSLGNAATKKIVESSGAFGSFAFPMPKAGGFGSDSLAAATSFGAQPALKPKHKVQGTPADIKPLRASVEQSVGQPSFGFGEVPRPGTMAAFSGSIGSGFGKAATSFGFGQMESTKDQPSTNFGSDLEKTANISNTDDTIDAPLPPSPSEPLDSPKIALKNEDAPLPPSPVLASSKEQEDSRVLSSSDEGLDSEKSFKAPQVVPQAKDTSAGIKELVAPSASTIEHPTQEAHRSTGESKLTVDKEYSAANTAKDELKQIPPFDFSASVSAPGSTDSSENSYVKVLNENKNLPGEVRSSGSGSSQRDFTNLSDANGEIDEASGDDEQYEDYSETEPEGDSNTSDNDRETDIEDEYDQETYSEDSSSANRPAASAFAPKTPAFVTKQDLEATNASPFADTSLLSSFGTSPTPATSSANLMFDFAGAAKAQTKDFPLQKTKTTASTSFSFSPVPQVSSSNVKSGFSLALTSAPRNQNDIDTSHSQSAQSQALPPFKSEAAISENPLTSKPPASVPQSGTLQTNAKTSINIVSHAKEKRPVDTAQRSMTLPEKPKSLVLPAYRTLDCTNIETSEVGIAREMYILVETLTGELATMGTNIGLLNTYLKEAPEYPECLDNVQDLMKDLQDMLNETLEYNESSKQHNEMINSIKSSMLRVEGQKTRVQRLLRAQTDPAFAHSLKMSSLGPAQIAEQKDLRRRIASIEKDLWDFQSSLSLVKAKLASEGLGTPATPSATQITVAVSKIMRLANQKEREVEDLQKRFVSLQLQSPDLIHRSATHSAHRKRRSQARFSIDGSFDLSMSQLSLVHGNTSFEAEKARSGVRRRDMTESGLRKLEVMKAFKDIVSKRRPTKTVPT